MTRRDRLVFAVFSACALAASAFVSARFEMDTDVTSFLPEGEDRELGQLSKKIAKGELSRMLVVTIGAPSEAEAIEASRRFEAALRGDASKDAALDDGGAIVDRLSFLEGGPPEDFERALFELYFPHRFHLFARTPEEAARAVSDEGLREAAVSLRARLGQPTSTLLSRLVPSDPFLTLPRVFESLEQGRGGDGLRVAEGRYLSSDGLHAVFFMGTRAEAFDVDAQRPLFAALTRAFDETNGAMGGALTMDQSGIHRFALRAEEEIKRDIARISVLSAVLLLGALLLLFRSVRFLGLASLPLGAGVLAGLTAVLAVHGRVHGITLAFGASLVGVTIDYVLHLYCHQAVSPAAGGPRAALRAIDRTLLTCAAATSLGFAVLLFSSLPGLREVGLFAVVGIATSLMVTRLVIPPLLPAEMGSVPARAWLVGALRPTLGALRRRRGLALAAFGAGLIFVAFTVPGASESAEGFSSMNALDPELLAEDQRVRDRVTRFEQMRFVVARGEDEASALAANERAARLLEAAVEDGDLQGFHGIHRLLPGPETQRGVAAALTADETLRARFEAVFADEGFVPSAFAPFFEALQGEAEAPRAPLTYDELVGSPLSFMVRSLRLELDDGVAFLTYLDGVNDEDALAQRFEGAEGAVFLRQGELFSRAESTYRARTLELLGLGLLAVFALVAFRERSVRKTLAALAPALLASAVTLGALSLSGRSVDLVTLTTLLIVVCLGVDYGLFLVDAEALGESHRDASLLAIFLAALSTLLGFGLLAMSAHPVLSAIGLTACVGIFSTLVLAPAAIAIAGLGEREAA